MTLLTLELLTADELRECRALLEGADWIPGRGTAGVQAAQVKDNEQLPPDGEAARALRAIVTRALDRSPLFLSATLPKRLYPPQVNRYTPAHSHYGRHVDNAVRFLDGGQRLRADLSCTLFLSDPAEYDGGELVIHAPGEQRRVRLPAGQAIIYPAHTVHEVTPVTRGQRLASFFWIESMVRGHDQRRLMLELDQALVALRQRHGESDITVALTGAYHNLLRLWADS